MITAKDQEELFRLISDYLEKDITCIAIGGTAMMFTGYKTATKDIDLVFKDEKDRKAFIKAIEALGYKEKSIAGIYDKKRKDHKNKPIMYTRGEERFDLFVKNVLGFELDFSQEIIVQRQDFIGKKELILQILGKEMLILLKAITGREKDHEDIEAIIKAEKTIDWELIITKASKQRKRNEWILIDLEEQMQNLRKITFIPEKHFKLLYKEQDTD